ncbi:hypothetical protein FI667_g13523, partial [Globisporangium splendens]
MAPSVPRKDERRGLMTDNAKILCHHYCSTNPCTNRHVDHHVGHTSFESASYPTVLSLETCTAAAAVDSHTETWRALHSQIDQHKHGDEAKLSNIKIKTSKATSKVEVCAWSQAVTSGEPKKLGHGPSPPLCQYSTSAVTFTK